MDEKVDRGTSSYILHAPLRHAVNQLFPSIFLFFINYPIINNK